MANVNLNNTASFPGGKKSVVDGSERLVIQGAQYIETRSIIDAAPSVAAQRLEDVGFSDVVDFARGALPSSMTFAGGSGIGTVGADGLMHWSEADIPRLAYDSEGIPLGLRIDGASANVVTKSKTFDLASWSATSGTVSRTRSGVGLDGDAGWLLTNESAGTATLIGRQSTGVTPAGAYYFAFVLSAPDSNVGKPRLWVYSVNESGGVECDLSGQVPSLTSVGTIQVTELAVVDCGAAFGPRHSGKYIIQGKVVLSFSEIKSVFIYPDRNNTFGGFILYDVIISPYQINTNTLVKNNTGAVILNSPDSLTKTAAFTDNGGSVALSYADASAGAKLLSILSGATEIGSVSTNGCSIGGTTLTWTDAASGDIAVSWRSGKLIVVRKSGRTLQSSTCTPVASDSVRLVSSGSATVSRFASHPLALSLERLSDSIVQPTGVRQVTPDGGVPMLGQVVSVALPSLERVCKIRATLTDVAHNDPRAILIVSGRDANNIAWGGPGYEGSSMLFEIDPRTGFSTSQYVKAVAGTLVPLTANVGAVELSINMNSTSISFAVRPTYAFSGGTINLDLEYYA